MSEISDRLPITTLEDLDDADVEFPRSETPDLHLTDVSLVAGLRTSGTTTSPGASDEDN